jgi:plastocyanin/methionine-rich copper-binding protein CopC
MKKLIIAAIVILALATAGIYWFTRDSGNQNQDGGDQGTAQKKSPHFLDSTPLHDEIYTAQPINVTINFDFDLAEGSDISVTDASGKEYTTGVVLIEDNKTALKKNLVSDMPAGTYMVNYTACWPDGSCHEGRFSFKINPAGIGEYRDMRSAGEVTIDMLNTSFVQNKVIVSPGTRVIWKNMDSVGHFVNTETHPEHTYFPQQNSRELAKDQTYAVVFTVAGQYNYHCSAHASTMLGSIIVSE